MIGEYQVTGGVGGRLPGALGPAELDGRAEWSSLGRAPARSLTEAVGARLGSEVDTRKVVLAVLGPLRPFLEGEPLGALAAELPLDLARELADVEVALCERRLAAPAGARDYLREVARLVMHPPARAASYVRAVFAAARAVLPPEVVLDIEERLPEELAGLWRAAR
jgi:uncharacterized protein (DUF2267 family)